MLDERMEQARSGFVSPNFLIISTLLSQQLHHRSEVLSPRILPSSTDHFRRIHPRKLLWKSIKSASRMAWTCTGSSNQEARTSSAVLQRVQSNINNE